MQDVERQSERERERERERGGLIKGAVESNSPTFHLVICFTLFPPGCLHLADIQRRANNQLSLQIFPDSAVALCRVFHHREWISTSRLARAKSANTGSFVDNQIAPQLRGNNKSLYYETAVVLMISIGQTLLLSFPKFLQPPNKGILSCVGANRPLLDIRTL